MNALVKTICTFVTSSIGRKIIVALTGLCLVLFLAGHLAGNLLIFGGPEWINTYAHGLHSMPEAALWGIRAGLAVGVDGIFAEIHPDPDHAVSDGPSQLCLKDVEQILTQAKKYDELTRSL